MKLYILVGAVAIAIITLVMMPAAAATERVTAMGTVVDELGRPVPGATVRLIDENFRELGATTSDANGNFKLVNVELAGSAILKVKVTLLHDGATYFNRLENMQWRDASQGLLSFDRNDTKLENYPESDHGYIWGPIMSSASNGRTLDGTVYLLNNTTILAADTGRDGAYMYEIEAAPGDYEIYAVHREGDVWLVSNRTKVTIAPSYAVDTSAPQMLVADVVTTSPPATPDSVPPVVATSNPTPHAPPPPTLTPHATPPTTPTAQASPGSAVKAVPLAMALVLGIVLIIAAWAVLGRKQ